MISLIILQYQTFEPTSSIVDVPTVMQTRGTVVGVEDSQAKMDDGELIACDLADLEKLKDGGEVMIVSWKDKKKILHVVDM